MPTSLPLPAAAPRGIPSLWTCPDPAFAGASRAHWLLLALMAAACVPRGAAAQDYPPVPIKGRVLDASTSQPLAGAVVRHLTGTAVTVTDSAGSFTILLPPDGRYPLRLEQLGYETSFAILPSTAPIETTDLYLTPAPLELQGIVVTVDRFAERRRRAMQPSRVVDAARLSEAYGNTYDVILRTIPGARPCPNDYQSVCKLARTSLGRGMLSRAGSRLEWRKIPLCLDDRVVYDARAEFDRYRPSDLYLMEVVEDFGVPSIRVYTRRFVADLATSRGNLRPWRFGCRP